MVHFPHQGGSNLFGIKTSNRGHLGCTLSHWLLNTVKKSDTSSLSRFLHCVDRMKMTFWFLKEGINNSA